MRGVIPVDGLECRQGLVHVIESKKTLAGRQHIAEACLLRHNGAPSSQIRHCAITEPAAPQPHILVFCDGPFAAGLHDILPLGIDVAAELKSRPHAPAVCVQMSAI